MYEPKPNTGSLWATPKKRISKAGKEYESHGGSAVIQCPHCQCVTTYWLNGFLKTTTKGGQIYDLAIAVRKDEKPVIGGIEF